MSLTPLIIQIFLWISPLSETASFFPQLVTEIRLTSQNQAGWKAFSRLESENSAHSKISILDQITNTYFTFK